MKLFFQVIEGLAPLPPELREALSAVLEPMEVPRGTVLLRVHTVCHYLYFVEEGLTRTFYFKGGRDITDWLCPEGRFACSIVSFISGHADRRGIETLEPCRLLAIHRDALEGLCRKYHAAEHLVRRIAAMGLLEMQQRFDDLHFATAADRYRRLLQDTPALVQRVPLGMLASYLGMSPETLSRIRARI